ncbi:MAG: exodeoxyribonuclease VII large subunit [Paenibacillus dendritiformis]|uniref:exodeoxyribonuclease VII large subunit n=1 Tax=Paenibacillus dendritiformis TaxID=130049 RepID=UPI00143DC908|nr:exodeoxyribonuclease VII large subunit [Paenibacillus dendritiformis]MDU5142751.1 exodeoxyribonuclease VII large subunit [Paenibacillus dendritiformis]NKI19795.1 exodeoxyribonuclease VII large subunit [Paenibacillus dendritiformis]NRF99913.1 exodeoxyribonuclease VII large subunit [Paenibacillus dendritiformis]GIO70769.1 exodeoxyribonuclease 7 large subunit [Paenibacillus dendritiformis]
MANQARVLSVKDLNRYIRMKLDGDARLQDVWVRGEISNFTHHSSGHMYFTLKDADSRLRTIMFASYNQRLPFRPKEGARVIARGNVTVYERDGQYQFYAQHMQPDGIGSLYAAFEQLKERLGAEGLFAAERKRPLPRYPKKIGVITSQTGAAVRDIIITLQRRQPGVHIVLYPVLVQGNQAAASIAAAIEAMNRHQEADVLIVGRGGGSLEELWAFNEEIVARAIAQSAIPIISAVGHETDFTIADFAADLRAPTPTAAAELAVTHQEELRQHLQHVAERMRHGMRRTVQQSQERLLRAQRSPVLRKPELLTAKHQERYERLRERLAYRSRSRFKQADERWRELRGRLREQTPVHQVRSARERLNGIERQLHRAMAMQMNERRLKLGAHLKHLDALSPLKIMARGYSLVYDEREENIIRTIRDVQLGDVVRVKLNDGQLDCHVWSMKGDSD